MDIIVAVFVFLFGAIVGSFLNVLVLRFGTGDSIVHGHSRCMHCGEVLRPYDLIPIVSYLLLRGRCRNCLTTISAQYIVVEMITGMSFFLIYVQNPTLLSIGMLADAALLYGLVAILIAIAVYDVLHFIIPDTFVAAAGVLALLYVVFSPAVITVHIFGACIVGGFLFILWFISKGRWMGFGDVKLGLVLGFLLTPSLAFLGLLLAFWVGAIWGILLIVRNGYQRGAQVPFGPFLIIGTLTSFLIGAEILAWYNNFIGF